MAGPFDFVRVRDTLRAALSSKTFFTIFFFEYFVVIHFDRSAAVTRFAALCTLR